MEAAVAIRMRMSQQMTSSVQPSAASWTGARAHSNLKPPAVQNWSCCCRLLQEVQPAAAQFDQDSAQGRSGWDRRTNVHRTAPAFAVASPLVETPETIAEIGVITADFHQEDFLLPGVADRYYDVIALTHADPAMQRFVSFYVSAAIHVERVFAAHGRAAKIRCNDRDTLRKRRDRLVLQAVAGVVYLCDVVADFQVLDGFFVTAT